MMGKLKIIGLLLLIIVVLLIIVKIYGPPVKLSERKNVSEFVEKYLINKYGNHKFKVTKVKYDFKMTTLFDYSNCIGYDVRFKSDLVKDSYVVVTGLKKNQYEITSDGFIMDYYFPDLDGYNQYSKRKSITPFNKIEKNLLEKIKNEFDSSIETLKCNNARLSIPSNLGRIPTLDELKNDVSYYEVLDFKYTLSSTIKNIEDYKNRLSVYLNTNYSGNWSIYYNANRSITCIKEV